MVTNNSTEQEDNSLDNHNQYQEEAYYRFGNTNAYAQSYERASKYSKYEMDRIKEEGGEIFKKLSTLMDLDPSDHKVQAIIQQWRDYISKYFYDCTIEIFRGLGKGYILDQRFTKNIDNVKQGLAKFLSDAIEIYCKSY